MCIPDKQRYNFNHIYIYICLNVQILDIEKHN